MCPECYVTNKRATPLLKPLDCLKNHTQYICGTCGRTICIETNFHGMQRWHFPFKTLEIAKLYLRSADYTMKTTCGIYEIENATGRVAYKIFAESKDLESYLNKHKDKICKTMMPLYKAESYHDYLNTEVRKLTLDEVNQYLIERTK